MTPDEREDVLTLGSDGSPGRGRLVLAVVVAGLLALAGFRWVTGVEEGSGEAPTAAGESRLAFAAGRWLHVGGRRITVQGPGVSWGARVHLRGQAPRGWLVTVSARAGDGSWRQANGVVDDGGGFHPWPRVTGFAGDGRAVVSPDGTLVLGEVDGRVRVLDASDGKVVATVPAGRPLAWTEDGIHLLRGAPRATVRAWDPATRRFGQRWDAHACEGSRRALVATLEAGLETCPGADLVAVSPSGERTLSAVPAERGAALVTDEGRVLAPQVRAGSGDPAVQELEGAAFLDDEHVLLAVTARDAGPDLTSFLRCSVATRACERVGNRFPAARGPGGAFLVLPPCHDADPDRSRTGLTAGPDGPSPAGSGPR